MVSTECEEVGVQDNGQIDMPIKLTLTLMTPFRRANLTELERRLAALEAMCPGDETCEVSIGERARDAWIHVAITRRRRTMLCNDWTMRTATTSGPYTYEAAFSTPDPSVDEMVSSVERMLRAPEDPV